MPTHCLSRKIVPTALTNGMAGLAVAGEAGTDGNSEFPGERRVGLGWMLARPAAEGQTRHGQLGLVVGQIEQDAVEAAVGSDTAAAGVVEVMEEVSQERVHFWASGGFLPVIRAPL